MPRLFRLFSPITVTFLMLFALSACDESESAGGGPSFKDNGNQAVSEYVFSIHPLHNPTRLHEIFGPLMRHLEEAIPDVKFRLEASRDYATYDKKLYNRQAHFSLPNPFQTINALEHGYRVFGKMGDDDNFRGIILVRKDSGITDISDLAGKAVSFPAPTALAATMLPQHYIHTHGLDVMTDIDIKYVGSQESSIMNVFIGDTIAGATWPPPWNLLASERSELAEQLEIKWQTDPLPNNGLIVRDDVPQSLTKKVAETLFSLHSTEQGKKLLKRMDLSQFETARNETYKPVTEFIAMFSKTVRPL